MTLDRLNDLYVRREVTLKTLEEIVKILINPSYSNSYNSWTLCHDKKSYMVEVIHLRSIIEVAKAERNQSLASTIIRKIAEAAEKLPKIF